MTKVTKPKAGVKHIKRTTQSLEDFFISKKAQKIYKRYYLEYNRYNIILDGSMVFVDDEEDVIGIYKPSIDRVKSLIYAVTGNQLD